MSECAPRSSVDSTAAAVSAAPCVLIAIGTNLGDRREIVNWAFEALDSLVGGSVIRSSVWQTSPVDCPPDSGDYLNAAAAFPLTTALPPIELLQALKSLETQRGRRLTAARNAPRELDLDLLLYGDLTMGLAPLILPHPRALGRRFVLVPSAEVAGSVVWPGTDKTIAQLSAEVTSTERIERVDTV